MENLLLPSLIEFREGDNPNTGSLVVTPCFYGYGTTLGNSLRRVLLSSLPGAAVEGFKIKGAQHEFSAVNGVKEDVVEIMLNLKQLAVKVFVDEPVVLTLSKKGPGEVKAGDIEKNSNIEIINKDLVIANITDKINFEMEIIVGRGRGFRPAENKDKKNWDLGTIICDSVYNPIKDVGYNVKYTRVGDVTDYEELTVNIETNGTISPKDALFQCVQILMDHYSLVTGAVSGENSIVLKTKSDEEEVESSSSVSEEPVESAEEKPKKRSTKKKSE